MPRVATKYVSYGTYTYRLLKEQFEKAAISKQGLARINALQQYCQQKIINCIIRITTTTDRITVRKTDVLTAATIVLPGEIGEDAHTFATLAINNYNKYLPGHESPRDSKIKKRVTTTHKTSLVFPPSRTKTFVRREFQKLRISETGAIAGAAVLEYVTRLLLQLSYETTLQTNKRRISDTHVKAAVRAHPILSMIFCKTLENELN